MKKETIIISLGGSLICPKDIDLHFLKIFVRLVKQQKNKKFIIITGGGAICRKYNAAFDLVSNTFSKNSKNNNVTFAKDKIGISMTKVNATLIQYLLKSVGLRVVDKQILNPKIKVKWNLNTIALGAGYLAGHSTDYDAALAAVANGAKKIINLTNIDYVYTADPRKHKNAKPIKSLTWDEYKKVLNIKKWTAGLHTPFDPLASQIAHKRRLTVLIANGENKKTLKTLFSKKIKGTIIHP